MKKICMFFILLNLSISYPYIKYSGFLYYKDIYNYTNLNIRNSMEFNSQNFSFFILQEKDLKEQNLFDLLKYSFSLNNLGYIKQIVIGSLKVRLNQGLLFSTSKNFSSVKQAKLYLKDSVVSKDISKNEIYLQGVSIDFSFNRLRNIFWTGKINYDEKIYDIYSVYNISHLRYLSRYSSLHTNNLLKHNFYEYIAGNQTSYYFNYYSYISVSFLKNVFSLPIIYNNTKNNDYTGQNYSGISLSLNFLISDVKVFSENTIFVVDAFDKDNIYDYISFLTDNYGKVTYKDLFNFRFYNNSYNLIYSTITGLVYKNKNLYYELIFRHYPYNMPYFHSGSFSVSDYNETGIINKIKIKLSKYFLINTVFDILSSNKLVTSLYGTTKYKITKKFSLAYKIYLYNKDEYNEVKNKTENTVEINYDNKFLNINYQIKYNVLKDKNIYYNYISKITIKNKFRLYIFNINILQDFLNFNTLYNIYIKNFSGFDLLNGKGTKYSVKIKLSYKYFDLYFKYSRLFYVKNNLYINDIEEIYIEDIDKQIMNKKRELFFRIKYNLKI